MSKLPFPPSFPSAPRGVRVRIALAALAISLVLAAATGGRAAAQECVALCAVACVKPITIADRWDDVTPIAGYTGGGGRGGSQTLNWQNNQRWDSEAFTDQDGDGLYDAGEPFVDGNGNGVHDAETYDPWLTGYLADPSPGHLLAPGGDDGLGIVLHLGSPETPPAPGQFFSIALPPANKGTPIGGSEAYVENFAGCHPIAVEPDDLLELEPTLMAGPTNQAMRNLIALDPDAYWDDASGAVQGSRHAVSPRIFFVAAHDPRLPLTLAPPQVQVRKVVAFFAEQMVGPAEVRGQLVKSSAVGTTCAGPHAGGFALSCPTPAQGSTWGRVKGAYR